MDNYKFEEKAYLDFIKFATTLKNQDKEEQEEEETIEELR